ncbi:kynurenine formamidase isoform X1 [Dermacentor andersoni]|uniref:kynurenine formamidase isoform X1 n=1 Tax=Dermacentor andersoni TaxID=34620 RepID=UPI003B3AB25B
MAAAVLLATTESGGRRRRRRREMPLPPSAEAAASNPRRRSHAGGRRLPARRALRRCAAKALAARLAFPWPAAPNSCSVSMDPDAEATSVMEDSEFLPSCWGHRLRGQALVDHFFRETARLSEETRSRVAAQKDIRFGEHPRECLDLYHGGRSPGERRSTLLFWHGGYWVAGDRQSHAFVADPFVAAGVAVAVAGYPLAPGATLDQMVDSATRCARHVLALRSGPLVLAGHSAGAHLAAMVATRLHGEPRLRGLLLLSPVLDVVALLGSSVARDAAIGTDQAVRNSPLQLVDKLPTHLHVVVTYAEHDPPWFGRTARAYREALGRRRISCELLEYADEDHFSFLLGALRDSAHRVTARLVRASLAATAPSPTPQ